MKRFVILSTQRSGSTWLRDVLDNHPAVLSYGELFLNTELERPRTDRFGPRDVAFFESHLRLRNVGSGAFSRARASISYLNELYRPRPEIEAVGFKLMYGQLRRQPLIAPYMALRRVHVIHLVRTNLLDVIVSRATVAERQVAHTWESVDQIQVTIPPAQLLAELRALQRSVERARRLLRALPVPVLEVHYESFIGEPRRFDELFEFLGLSAAADSPVRSSMKKLNVASRSEIISNYADVERALAPTPFAIFLGPDGRAEPRPQTT
jgi:hypothetical protein